MGPVGKIPSNCWEVSQSERAADVLQLASGRPLLALSYLEGDQLQQREQFEELLGALRRGDQSVLAAAQQCQKLDGHDALDWFSSHVHQLARGEFCESPRPALFEFYQRLQQARQWLQSGSNPNPQLLWEELLLGWVRVVRS